MSDDMMSQAKSRLKEIEEIKDIGQFIIDNSSTISAVTTGISFETDDKRNAFVTFWKGDIISCLGLSSVCTLDIEQVIEH
tara:strand:+ start:272 stop:511 length:240 start_codon:yes stop_codon:yes gene_type:complete